MDRLLVSSVFTATRALLLFLVQEFGTTGPTQVSAEDSDKKENDEEGDMIKGLAIGLGGFFGLVIFLCLLWKCCCNNDDSSDEGCCGCCPDRNKKGGKTPTDMKGRRRMNDHGAKVSPSPPSSAMSWSRNS